MSTTRHVTLHHAPQSRSAGALFLMEELGAGYELHVLNLKKGEQRQADYLAINPMGKVPALSHDGELITEQGAIYIYMGDLYADKGLAPQMGEPLRGAYLRWLVFYGSAFEPAVVDKALKREPGSPSTVPYGDYDTMFATLSAQLAKGPYLLGERFTVADVLWGAALNWTTRFGIVEATPVIRAYIDRVIARPAFARAAAIDAELLAKQAG